MSESCKEKLITETLIRLWEPQSDAGYNLCNPFSSPAPFCQADEATLTTNTVLGVEICYKSV
jgi:hypothetical protein